MATKRTRFAAWAPALVIATVAVTVGATAGRRLPSNDSRPAAARRAPARDAAAAETLVASLRAEPRSFNRYVARDLSTNVVTLLMHDSLVRVNRVTNELEPALAERWELVSDRQTYRLQLRANVRFSDGTPFTADDVAFSFRAIYDQTVGSPLADSLRIGGQPLTVTATDARTVTVRFPSPFAPGLRMLDGIPVYPRHRLEAALKAGNFQSSWGLSASRADLAGLGPFVLRQYEPGQRLSFERNPYYWRRDSQLPRVSRIVLEVIPEQDAELLELETGGIDLTQGELRPSDIATLRRPGAARNVALSDAGIGVDGDLFWVNLTPAKARDSRSRWLQHPDFRRSVAHAIDRQAFVDSVYLGAAVAADSIVSPGNREWHVAAAAPDYDLERAKTLLASLGLSARNGEGTLEDRDGHAARFTLLTQKGNTSLERGAAMIRDSLARVGVRVDVVALEAGAVVDYILRGEFDAAYFRLLTTDTDPALNLDFWLSSGSAHVWNAEQKAPATQWESEIDSLMQHVATTLDPDRRRQLFAEVQRIMAREVPVLCFAFPRQTVAINSRVDATPAPFRPPVLWNAAQIGIRAVSH